MTGPIAQRKTVAPVQKSGNTQSTVSNYDEDSLMVEQLLYRLK